MSIKKSLSELSHRRRLTRLGKYFESLVGTYGIRKVRWSDTPASHAGLMGTGPKQTLIVLGLGVGSDMTMMISFRWVHKDALVVPSVQERVYVHFSDITGKVNLGGASFHIEDSSLPIEHELPIRCSYMETLDVYITLATNFLWIRGNALKFIQE